MKILMFVLVGSILLTLIIPLVIWLMLHKIQIWEEICGVCFHISQSVC